MYVRFRKDPFFLQRYSIISFLVFSVLVIGLAILKGSSNSYWPWLPVVVLFAHSSFRSVVGAALVSMAIFFFRPEAFHLGPAILYVVGGVYAGIWSNVLIHNASHNMIKPAWLNRLVGELAGIQVLSGFPGFAVLHMEHHRHADDEALDPHPNLPGQTFWRYVDETRARLRLTFVRIYHEAWGQKDLAYLNSWKKTKWLLPVNRSLRAAFLLLLLGPLGFTFFFISSHITTQLAFAVINFYSHRRREDGTVEVRNLDGNWIFWILNRGFSGAFYHRNHHLNPKLFNPMKMRRWNA